jgi:hypothetical protein
VEGDVLIHEFFCVAKKGVGGGAHRVGLEREDSCSGEGESQ